MSAGMLITDGGEASMGVSTPQGTHAALEGYDDGRAGMAVRDSSSAVRVDVTLDSFGTAGVGVVGPPDRRAVLGAGQDGRVGLVLSDGPTYRADIGLRRDAEPFIRLLGPEGYQGDPLWEAP